MMPAEFFEALDDLLDNFGAHDGDCETGPRCQECGQPASGCGKHAEAFARRQQRLRDALINLPREANTE